jgi:hypothetical protein
MKTAELAAAFRVSEATIHAKARLINNALGVSVLDPRWTVSSLTERNPLTLMALDPSLALRRPQREAVPGILPSRCRVLGLRPLND